ALPGENRQGGPHSRGAPLPQALERRLVPRQPRPSRARRRADEVTMAPMSSKIPRSKLGQRSARMTASAPSVRHLGPRAVMSGMDSEIVVGLDIGTTKVSAVVGEVDESGITVLGVGNVPCRGLRKGVVSNIDWTTRSIAEAIELAQTMAGVEIRTVYAGISGSHIRCQSSDGVAAVTGGEVTS